MSKKEYPTHQMRRKTSPFRGGYKANTLYVVIHILAAGQVVSACGVGRAQAPTLKQEPTYGVTY